MKRNHCQPTRRNHRHTRRGFTLIELLVVIAIIAVLMGLLLPAVQQAREAARRSQCANNLKQVALAIHNFEDANKTLPSSRMGPQHATWFVQILPYLDQKNLYEQWTLPDSYYTQTLTARTSFVPPFTCPSRRASMLSTQFEISSTGIPDTQQYPGILGDYAANGGRHVNSVVDNPSCQGTMCSADSTVVGTQVVKTKSQVKLADITDGTTNTFLVGEKHVPRSFYGQSGPSFGDGAIFNGDYPRNYNRLAGLDVNGVPRFNLGKGPDDLAGPWHCKFGSDHVGICQFAFGDGHVASISTSVDINILTNLAVRNDGKAENNP